MPRFRCFNAYVEVDGVPVPEYGAKVGRDAAGVPCVTCWVPSESGKTFRVHCVDYRAPRSTDEYVFKLDGVFAQGTITRGDYDPPVTTLAAIPYPDGHRQLVFADLGTTDDERALHVRGSPNLGEIALRITPVRILGYTPPYRPAVRLAKPVVHERSKKAGTHAIQPGAPVYAPQVNTVQTQHIAMPEAMDSQIEQGLLQAQGIAPPPVTARLSPPPARRAAADVTVIKTVDKSDEQDEGEIRRLEERLRQLRKRKRSADVKVKEEPSARRPRLSSTTDFIDLASD